MAKKKARTKFAGTRVDNEMDRWLKKHEKNQGWSRSHVVSKALWDYRRGVERHREMFDATQRRIVAINAACCCSPDDRAKVGCRCGAGVEP